MTTFFTRVTNRFKKYFIVITLFPLLLGAFGYFLPKSTDAGTSYNGSIDLFLGLYEDTTLNNSEEVRELLLSYSFLLQSFPDLGEQEILSLKQNITVRTPSDAKVSISYSGMTREEVEKTLNQLVNTFLEMDEQRYNKKKAIIETTAQVLKSEPVSEDSVVTKEQFLYELENKLVSLKHAEVVNPLIIEDNSPSSVQLSSKQKGDFRSINWFIVIGMFRDSACLI